MADKDDFDRQVYCIAGLLVDAVKFSDAIHLINRAVQDKKRYFLTTPNLNFLISAQSDRKFCDSVVSSDLVIPDGFSIVLLARFLGIPICERVAGSTLFENLYATESDRKLTVFFFGGPEGVAERASKVINQYSMGLNCVGHIYPGFKSVDEMSNPEYIEKINQARPDFLVVSLGAKKGQDWIEKNLSKLDVSVVSHLGAVVNFIAGSVKRAPLIVQKVNMEWLWRIKEEPTLWRRYFKDFIAGIELFVSKVMPYTFLSMYAKLTNRNTKSTISIVDGNDVVCIHCNSKWYDKLEPKIREDFRYISIMNKNVILDCKNVYFFSSNVLGLILVLTKYLKMKNKKLTIANTTSLMNLVLYCNNLTYLKQK